MKKNLLFMFMLMLALSLGESWAQERTVSGKVTSLEDGTALPGVNVVIKGTTTGTVTDFDGNYALNVPQAGGTLVFSFIGLATQEIEVGSRAVIDIQMEPDVKQLTEVVVTAFGIEQDAKGLGYAVTQIEADDVTKGRTSDAMSALQGKVAGVNISTASGAPGASTKVILRGYSSLNNNNPLYVVDGVPINNSSNNFNDPSNAFNRSLDFGNRANDINPDDIASMTILKGASATALYGSRAANGVIVITTKKGQSQQGPRVSLTSSATFSRPLRLPQLQNRFGQGWNGHYASEENGSWGPRLDGVDRLHGNVVDNSQQIKAFKAMDNLKDFYETGTSYINTLAISGGNELATYYVSYGNVRQDGIVPSDKDTQDRHTASLRGSVRGDKLNVSGALNYTKKDISAIATGQGGDGATLFQDLIQVPRDKSIVDFRDYKDQWNNIRNFYTPYAINPYWIINEDGSTFSENRVYGNVTTSYQALDWLNFTYRVGLDVANSNIKQWVAKYTVPEGPNFGTQTDLPGAVIDGTQLARQIDHSLLVSGSFDLTEDIKLNTLVGFNANERYFFNTSVKVTDLTLPNFYNVANSSSTPTVATLESKRRLVGLFGKTEFSYQNMLFLSFLARNDWSSTLPIENNSFFYPGVNASFVFTDLLGTNRVLSAGKIRASWGKTGNDAQPYQVYSVLIPGQVTLPFGNIDYPIAGASGYEVSNNIGNNKLQPEITTEYELGIDLRLFDSRFRLDAAYYNKQTTDQILNVPVTPSSGYTSQTKNLGNIRNQGIELNATLNVIETGDFRWNLGMNYTMNRNKVESLNEDLEEVIIWSAFGIEMVAIPGQPLGVIRGHTEARDSQGRIIVNNAGIPTTADDKVIYGDINPDFTLGANTSLAFKGFTLSATADYRKGGIMYSYTQRLTQFVGNATVSLYNDRKPFIVPNSVKPGIEPGSYVENDIAVDMNDIFTYWNQTNNNSRSQDHVFDRSYFKLREVSISYDLPNSILSKTPFRDIRLGIVGRNLLLVTSKENNIIDPESTTFGNDIQSEFGEFAVGPTTRNIGFTLNATF